MSEEERLKYEALLRKVLQMHADQRERPSAVEMIEFSEAVLELVTFAMSLAWERRVAA